MNFQKEKNPLINFTENIRLIATNKNSKQPFVISTKDHPFTKNLDGTTLKWGKANYKSPPGNTSFIQLPPRRSS